MARPETHRFVCHLCGEEEFLLYQPPRLGPHVCGTCEEEELMSGVERRRWLHWWPIPFVLLLLVAGGAYAACSETAAPSVRDPVTNQR